MKKVLFTFLAFLLVFVGCKKEEPAPKDGKVIFWNRLGDGIDFVDVTIGNATRTITKDFASTPECDREGGATFTLAPGTYSYRAKEDGGLFRTWSGSVTISSNGCQTMLLSPSSGGGGGSSSNNPPPSSTGNAMFWTSSDLGCGQISVTCAGQSGTISSYYSSTTPNCGASGCANFTLPAGTYNFSASCTSKTWNGSITVTTGSCSRIRLTN